MRAPVGDVAAGVVVVVAKPAEKATWLVSYVRRGAEVEVPVEVGRLAARCFAAVAARMPIDVVPNSHKVHAADFAGLHHLLRRAIVRRRSMLRAVLHDAIVAAGRVDDRPPFGDGMRQRLFDVDVLAGGAGEHGRRGMPMVRRGDQYGVDVVAIERAAKIAIRRALAARPIARATRVAVVHVASSDELHARGALHPVGDQPAAAAASDQRDAHAVVRTKNAAVGDRRRRGAGGDGRQERSSTHRNSLRLTSAPSPTHEMRF